MRKLSLILITALAACGQQQDKHPAADSSKPGVISNDTIPETRTTVKNEPVAGFSQPIKDELNNWKFSVQVYETRRTFHYSLRVQYKELRISDSLTIPNFGTMPKVELRKGPEPYSCIIGFIDKKGDFREYRKAFINSNDQLRIKTIHSYYVGVTRAKK